MSSFKLSVHLVTWNGEKYIPFLFESLRTQSFRDWQLLVVDNASTDGTVAAIQKELINFPVASRLIVNKENLGFARGHNQAYAQTSGDYFLIINQDLVLAPDCIDKLFNFLSSNPNVAAAAPRTMRWNFEEKILTNTVDSLGLKVFRSRRVVDIAQGEPFSDTSPSQRRGQGEVSPIEVFGVSGAIALFHRRAIFETGYLFDESYHSYKEDVDLAYRLQSAGFKSYVSMGAVAYHDRSSPGVGAIHESPLQRHVRTAQNKSTQSNLVRYNSYKNHLATLYKNEYWQNFLLDWPWIMWYELKKFVYFLLFDRPVLGGIWQLWKERKELWQKRAVIKELRWVSWNKIRKLWQNQKSA